MAAKKNDAAGAKDALEQAKLELLEQGKKAGKIEAKDITAKIPDVGTGKRRTAGRTIHRAG
jgi:hypothetical protein